MRPTARGAIIGALLTASALTLVGCSAPAPAADDDTSIVDETTTVDESTEVVEETREFAPVVAADIPDWVPADLPMPEGDYLRGIPYDLGVQLDFALADEGAAQRLVDALLALGYVETQYTEHPGGTGATWFTEGPEIRANVVLTDTDTEPLLSYNLEQR